MLRACLLLATQLFATQLFAATPAPKPADKHEAPTLVFACAGQSNMDGRAPSTALTGPLEAFAKPREDVLIRFASGGLKRPLRGNKAPAPLAPGCSENGKQFGPELGFGQELAKAYPGRKLVLVKVAEGGTNLHTDWDPQAEKKLYARLLACVRETEAHIAKSGAQSEIAGVIWMQGESDAGKEAAKYQERLTAFIARVRLDLKSDQLPFVVGEVCSGNKSYAAIRQAQAAVAAKIPGVGFASSKELTTTDKDVHFDAASQIELGRRFAAQIVTLRKAQEKK